VKVFSSLVVYVSKRLACIAARSDILLDIDLDTWLTTLVNDLEREVLDVALNVLVLILATDKTLDVEDGPFWVRGILVLGCKTCQ